MNQGERMYELMEGLWPICRSITGDGVRKSLQILQKHIPLVMHEVPSGTVVGDWIVPREWNISEAFIEDSAGNKIVDFTINNLHVVGYSVPVDKWMDLGELQNHLHSIEEQPNAIPYVTSYYKEIWGFCLTHDQRQSLKAGQYHVVIKSSLTQGSLTYGELILKGSSSQEIFLSTYVCHPSMANNELSGPVVMTELVKWLMNQPRRYTYRIVFIPETIGAITYLSKHLAPLKANVVAGFNLSCVGDDRAYSFVSSRYGNTLADQLISAVLGDDQPGHVRYSYLDRGSDERQYCAPGVDLPLVTFCRSKFGTYPEYHTSLDNLSIVSADALQGSFDVMQRVLELAESNYRYRITTIGEPQLGKRGLYPTTSTKKSIDVIRDQRNFIAYADGQNDLLAIRRITGLHYTVVIEFARLLGEAGLLEKSE